TATDTPPGNFRIRFGAPQTAYLNWSPPGGQTRYELSRLRSDGSDPAVIPLLSGSTSFAEYIGDVTTCYQLAAFNGNTLTGRTQEICAAPNLSFFPAGASGLGLNGALDRQRVVPGVLGQ